MPQQQPPTSSPSPPPTKSEMDTGDAGTGSEAMTKTTSAMVAAAAAGEVPKIPTTITEAIECCICLDVFQDPVVIPDCAHIFCRNCISEVKRKGLRQCEICADYGIIGNSAEYTCKIHFKCPVCRHMLGYSTDELLRMPTDRCLQFTVSALQKIKLTEQSIRQSSRIKFKTIRDQLHTSRCVLDRIIKDDTHGDPEIQSKLNNFREKFVVLSGNAKRSLDNIEFGYAKSVFFQIIEEWLNVNDRVHKLKKRIYLAKLGRTSSPHQRTSVERRLGRVPLAPHIRVFEQLTVLMNRVDQRAFTDGATAMTTFAEFWGRLLAMSTEDDVE